jgi:hypothetical protein
MKLFATNEEWVKVFGEVHACLQNLLAARSDADTAHNADSLVLAHRAHQRLKPPLLWECPTVEQDNELG